MDFNKFKTFIFDLDGTLWYWTNIFPRAEKVVDKLNDLGKQVLFVTNNTLLSRKGFAKKLNAFGIEAKEEDVINPSITIGEYIKRRRGRAVVFSDGLKEDLKKFGIKVVENPPAKYLVVGYDQNFNQKKLEIAVETLEKGAKFLTSAKGKRFIFSKKLVPGTGAIVEAVEKASGKKSVLLGKPSKFFQELVELNVESPRNETVLFGDELNSDILMGNNSGYFTVLVRTGIDKIVRGRIKPDLVLNSVADVKI
jgi:4-nitrophenyl phosphatase